jgi:hypothetical protein
MRIAPALALCAALLSPGMAGGGPRECENLSRDIERYEDMADRAGAQGNPEWEARMRQQAQFLEGRQEERCSDGEMIASTTECLDMTRRIERYEELAERAAELGNPMWEQQAREHIEALKKERSERCPEWSPAAVANRAIMRMLKTAGELALTYFTMGYF